MNYNAKINLTNFHFNESTSETSHSVVKIEAEYPYYEGEIDSSDIFLKPSLYNFAANDNFDDRNLYISGSTGYNKPNFVFSEATASMAVNQRISLRNLEYKYFYTSSVDYDRSLKSSTLVTEHFYSSKSLHPTDLDTEYQHSTSHRRMFFEGVKNTIETTIDGRLPIIITTTAPTIITPLTAGQTPLQVDTPGATANPKDNFEQITPLYMDLPLSGDLPKPGGEPGNVYSPYSSGIDPKPIPNIFGIVPSPKAPDSPAEENVPPNKGTVFGDNTTTGGK